MTVSAVAVARLYERDPQRVRQRYTRPVLLWEVPTSATWFDEFAPRLTHDLGPRPDEEPVTDAACPVGESRLNGAIVFEVRKAQHGGDGIHSAVTVGRSVTNDLQIDHPSVSRVHAFLSPNAAGDWILSDVESRNGTFVGEDRVLPRHGTRVQSGDLLRLGSVWLRFLSADDLFLRLSDRVSSEARLPT